VTTTGQRERRDSGALLNVRELTVDACVRVPRVAGHAMVVLER
jgi:hypothetical protein